MFATVTGYLFITGRIKEILITRGGENVAPVPIEEQMKDTMKLLSYCVVIGDNQKFPTMLVSVRCEVRQQCFSYKADRKRGGGGGGGGGGQYPLG